MKNMAVVNETPTHRSVVCCCREVDTFTGETTHSKMFYLPREFALDFCSLFYRGHYSEGALCAGKQKEAIKRGLFFKNGVYSTKYMELKGQILTGRPTHSLTRLLMCHIETEHACADID